MSLILVIEYAADLALLLGLGPYEFHVTNLFLSCLRKPTVEFVGCSAQPQTKQGERFKLDITTHLEDRLTIMQRS